METIKLSREDTEAVVKAFENFNEEDISASESFNKFKAAALKYKELIQSEED